MQPRKIFFKTRYKTWETNSYIPKKIGISKRYNLKALDEVKTLLNSSGVPQKFWVEDLLCFIYVWNEVCHKGNKQTPKFSKHEEVNASVSEINYEELCIVNTTATALFSLKKI